LVINEGISIRHVLGSSEFILYRVWTFLSIFSSS
jgi:hypothetical protein